MYHTFQTYNSMKSKLFLLLSLVYFTNVLIGQNERDIVSVIQSSIGGVCEYVTTDHSRVDLLTNTHAYEVDFASKWKESIGQSLWYAIQTNKKAGIILILESKTDFKYVQKLQSTIDFNGLSSLIDVKIYPTDFQVRNATLATLLPESDFWLSINSKVRHNKNCTWFKKSSGKHCSASDGKAGGCCGG